MSMRTKNKNSLVRKNRKTGRLFVLIWEIGFICFILIPLVESMIYSFSDVKIGIGGFKINFVGLEKYYYIFLESPKYVDNLLESITSFFTSIPIIFALSLILGIVLNQQFKGRMLFRSLYFIPVIMSTGIILDFIMANDTAEQMRALGQSTSGAYVTGPIDLSLIFMKMNIPDSVSELILGYIGTIFDLMWDCGVPIVLFIAGLQSVPTGMYEAATVEGVTSWENFWYITFPMLANTSVLVLVYIATAFFTKQNNPVIQQAFTVMQKEQVYSTSAAMLWAYFLIIIILSAIIFLLLDRLWLRRLR